MTYQEWNKQLREKYYQWCNDDQWECCEMILNLIDGKRHLCVKIREYGDGVAYNTRNHSPATFDGSLLTNMVFMAHDRKIRVEIKPSSSGILKLCLCKRHNRKGRASERHPTIETALANYRGIYEIGE